MTKVYEVVNRAGRGSFILAFDESHALQQALEFGLIKKRENGYVIDVTNILVSADGGETLQELLNGNATGWAAKQVGCLTLPDLLNGNKPTASQWFICNMGS